MFIFLNQFLSFFFAVTKQFQDLNDRAFSYIPS